MSSCGNTTLRSCLNISKERLDGRRAVWVGSPLTTEKVTLTESLFWCSPLQFPFCRAQENENIFCVVDFKAFGRRRLLLFSGEERCWSANQKLTGGTSGWPQPTLLIQETVYHMSPKSAAIDSSEIASAVTLTLPAVSVIPGSSICLDICVHIYFWLKNPCHTDRNAERAAATDWKAVAAIAFFVRLSGLTMTTNGRICFTISWKEKSLLQCGVLKSWLQMLIGSQ